MKAILLVALPAIVALLWNRDGLSQSLLPISKTPQIRSAECNPPFHVTGLFDTSVPNSPDAVIFSQEVKDETMSDHLRENDRQQMLFAPFWD